MNFKTIDELPDELNPNDTTWDELVHYMKIIYKELLMKARENK